MNTNQMIRVGLVSALIAAVGCADGQRSTKGRAGKGKRMMRAIDPSSNITNGKPGKMVSLNSAADTKAESKADDAITALEASLEVGTKLDDFPEGSFRLVSSVTVYKYWDTNEIVKAAHKVTYAADAAFTPDAGNLASVGKFRTAKADAGLNLAVPTTLSVTNKKLDPTEERLLFTKVDRTSAPIKIVETLGPITAAQNNQQGITVARAIVNLKDRTADGKVTATARSLQLMGNLVRVILLVEESQPDPNAPKLNRNVYLTYQRTGEPAKEAPRGAKRGADADGPDDQNDSDMEPRIR